MRHEYIQRFTALLSGADAGFYALPTEVTAARGILARAEKAATVRARPDIEASRARFAAEILASTDADWPDPARMVAVGDTSRAFDEWQIAVQQAQLSAEQSLYEVLSADPDRLISDFLRTSHTEAVETAKEHAALAPLADDPTVMSALTGSQRTKVDKLAGAAAQYAAVRAAWSGLTRTGQATRNDHEGVFAELRDLTETWPTFRQRGNDAPWPTGAVARLCWLAVNAEPWLPTVEQQEARWAEVFGAQLEQAKVNQHALRGFASIGGGGL